MKKDYIMDRNLSYKNQNTEKVKKRKHNKKGRMR